MSEFNATAERALTQAVDRAAARKSRPTTLDLLQALRSQQNSAAWQVLSQAQLLSCPLPEPEDEGDGGIISACLLRATEQAAYVEAGALFLGTQHLLQGLLLEEEGVGGRWLREKGLQVEAIDWQNLEDPVETPPSAPHPLLQKLSWTGVVGVWFGLGLLPHRYFALTECYGLVALMYLPNLIRNWVVGRTWVRSGKNCSRCQRECELPSMFDPQSGLCRPCQRAMERQPGRDYLLILAAAGVVASLAWGFQWEVAPLLANFTAALILLVLATFLHEMGHALVAAVCGDRVLSIHLGRGVVEGCRRVGRTCWFLHLPLLGGLTVNLPGRLAGYRIKSILFALGGVTVNFFTAWLLWRNLQSQPEWNLSLRWLTAFDPALTFFYLNLTMGIANLIPADIRLESGRLIPNDGKGVLLHLQTPSADSPKLRQQMALLQCGMYATYENVEAQWEVLQTALERDPSEPTLKTSEMLLLLELGRLTEALVVCRDIPECRADATPAEKGARANNLAWCHYKCGELVEAERLSARSLEGLPNHPNVCGTRGEVLLALGRFEEGRELLWKAVRSSHEAPSAAHHLSALVRLAALQSDQVEFVRLRELALLLDPSVEIPETMELQVAEVRRCGHCVSPVECG